MPEIPPWLSQGPAYGQLYATGAKLGADIGAQNAQTSIERSRLLQTSGIEQARLAQSGVIDRARLAQEAQRNSQNYQLAQDELEQRRDRTAREDMVRQQQLEIEKSYKEQMISLQQQELEQKKRAMDEKIQQAAQQYQAQQQFKDMITAAGENPNIMNIAAQSGLMGQMSGQGIASMQRAFAPKPQATLPSGVPPGFTMIPDARSGFRVVPTPKMTPAPGESTEPEMLTIGGQPFYRYKEAGKTKLGQIRVPTVKPPADNSGKVSQLTRARVGILQKKKALIKSSHLPFEPKKEALRKVWQDEEDQMKAIDDEIETLVPGMSTTSDTGNKIGDYTWEIVDESGDSEEE